MLFFIIKLREEMLLERHLLFRWVLLEEVSRPDVSILLDEIWKDFDLLANVIIPNSKQAYNPRPSPHNLPCQLILSPFPVRANTQSGT